MGETTAILYLLIHYQRILVCEYVHFYITKNSITNKTHETFQKLNNYGQYVINLTLLMD